MQLWVRRMMLFHMCPYTVWRDLEVHEVLHYCFTVWIMYNNIDKNHLIEIHDVQLANEDIDELT